MKTILLMLAALSFVPAFADIEDEARQYQTDNTWHLGEGLEAGDTFRYLICDVRSTGTCYHADLHFQSHDADSGQWTVFAQFQDILGHLVPGKYGAEQIMSVSGNIQEDLISITYITLRHAADPINGTYYTDDSFLLMYDEGYAGRHPMSLFNSVMLIGGKIPVGGGTFMEHPPKLDIGTEWASPNLRSSILVTSDNARYSHGTVTVDGAYNIEYASSRPVAYVQILDGFPFPLQGEVVAEYSVLRNDPNVQFRHWYKLLDTNKLTDTPGSDPGDIFDLGPPPILEELIVELPKTGIDIIDDVNATLDIGLPDSLPDPSANPLEGLDDVTVDELYQRFLDWIGVKEGSQKRADLLSIETDKDRYNLGDIVKFSGLAVRSIGTDAAVITLSVTDDKVVTIPVSIQDGMFHHEAETHSWDFSGLVRVEIMYGDDIAGTAFEFRDFEAGADVPEVTYTLEGREVGELAVYADSILLFLEPPGNFTSGTLVLSIPDRIFPRSDSEIFIVSGDTSLLDFERRAGDDADILDIMIDENVTVIEVTTRATENDFACLGSARCIETTITRIIDGDTIKMRDGQNVRFALASAPELSEQGGEESKVFIESICPVGSDILVDEDDLQGESYSRIVGVVYCNGSNLNSELLDSGGGYVLTRFCSGSEFSGTDWAARHGC